MYKHIDEPIQVYANFTKKGPTPMCFTWRNKDYNIESVNFIHKTKKGDKIIVYYSVSTETENYKLAFNTKYLTWKLEEVYFAKFSEDTPTLNDKYTTLSAEDYNAY